MGIQVVRKKNGLIVTGRAPAPAVIVLCDADLCDKALEFPNTDQFDAISEYIRESQPHGWFVWGNSQRGRFVPRQFFCRQHAPSKT